MTASCSYLLAARGSHTNDVEDMFAIFYEEIFVGAAGLPGGARAMAAIFARKMARAAAAAATGRPDLSLLQ